LVGVAGNKAGVGEALWFPEGIASGSIVEPLGSLAKVQVMPANIAPSANSA
jgi:hypothetical protein